MRPHAPGARPAPTPVELHGLPARTQRVELQVLTANVAVPANASHLADVHTADGGTRLFDTPRAAFCPGEHCSVPCGPRTCTCKPCETSCVFCAARRARPVARFEISCRFRESSAPSVRWGTSTEEKQLMAIDGLCECGCGQRTPLAVKTDRSKNWVRGEPLRFVLGHNQRRDPVKLLRSQLTIDPTTECWLWTRGSRSGGYGRLLVGGEMKLAHRVMYEAVVGPVPDGMHLDHLCRNRACINPEHLEPVTPGENVRRGEGISALNARKTHCHRGHEFTPENTYVHDGMRTCRACRRLRHKGEL